ncbi:MAG TPA: HDOD domain-containing protein [Malonomonas sp.]
MALVYIDDLTEGMILAEDLFTPKGFFVLAAGMPLQQDHLQRLKGWGVVEVAITEASLGEEYQQLQAEIAQFVDRAEGYLYRRCHLNDLSKEPLATIFRHTVNLYAKRLQRGWSPVNCSADQLPAETNPQQPPPSAPQLLLGDVELFCLPSVYARIVQAINSPNSSSAQVAEAVSKDANLSIRLLRMVNSPSYGFSEKVDSVTRAVSLLGTDDLTNLAVNVNVRQQFGGIPPQMISMDSFWRHSIRCGLFARILAGHLGLPGNEIYFTGGLLHDIGRLVMLDRMPDKYGRAIAKGLSEQLPNYRAEQETLQTDHSILGKLLAMRWRLPTPVTRMIGGHHSPASVHYAPEACLAHVADFLAHATGHEVNLVNELPPLQMKAWEELKLKEEFIAPTIRQVEAEFRKIISFFQQSGDV